MCVPARGSNADAAQERVAEAADEAAVAVERQRVADHRPRDRGDRQRGDAHHERVQRVLRAHEARVEEAQRRRHEQHQRGGGEHPGGVARVHSRRHHAPTGVTAALSVSPVRMRTTCSSPTTKILPSPTSPVRPPSHSASIVGSDELVGHGDLEAHLVGHADAHGRAAVGLHAVELPAVPLHGAHGEPAHLCAIQRLQHLVGLLWPHDPDHELHAAAACRRQPGASLALWRKRRAIRCPSGQTIIHTGRPLRSRKWCDGYTAEKSRVSSSDPASTARGVPGPCSAWRWDARSSSP